MTFLRTKNEENIYMIDFEANKFHGVEVSYVLMGKTIIIVETGPASSVYKLIHILRN